MSYLCTKLGEMKRLIILFSICLMALNANSTTRKEQTEEEPADKAPAPTKVVSRFGTPKRPKYGEFLNLKTEQELNDALEFISKLSDDNKMKEKLKANIEQQLKALKTKKSKN